MLEFPHPVSGELLETPADFQRALGDLSEQLAPLYQVRRLIEEARAERFPILETCAKCGHAKEKHWEGVHVCDDWGPDGRACRCKHFAPMLPAPRSRTPTQDKVARCPRCNGRLDG